MLATILIVSLAFYWLLRETDYFRIHLIRGPIASFPLSEPWLTGLWLHTFEPLVGAMALNNGLLPREYCSYHPEPTGYTIKHSLNGRARTNGHYEIILSPNVEGLLCGGAWLSEHWNDLKDYNPEVYMSIGNVRYNMTIKQPSIIKDIMRVNKLSKREIQALA